MVKADGSGSRGHGFKPRHPILDECNRLLSYYILDNNENIGSRRGTPKKRKEVIKKRLQGLLPQS